MIVISGSAELQIRPGRDEPTTLPTRPTSVAVPFVNLAPTQDAEAAMLRILGPANYTALVRGKNETTGIGLVEFYRLPPQNP